MKIKLLICLFTLPVLLMAQEDFSGDIRWGEPIISTKKDSGPIPIGVLNDDFYALKRTKKGMIEQRYALPSFGLQKENPITLVWKGHKMAIIDYFIFGERVMYITVYIDDEIDHDKRVFLMHEIVNGQVNNPIELARIEDEWGASKIGSRTLLAYDSRFSTVVSEDRKSLAILFLEEKVKGQPDPTIYNVVLYNEGLEEVNRGKIDTKDFAMGDRKLSNTGKLFIPGFQTTTEKGKGIFKFQKIIKGDAELWTFDTHGLEKVKIDIHKKVKAMAVKIFGNEDVIVYGMYANEKISGVSGAFFRKMDEKMNTVFESLEPFEDDFITQFWTDREKKKAEKKKAKNAEKDKEDQELSFYEYVLHDLVIKENGDFVLLAEQYYTYETTVTTTSSNGSTTTRTIYHYVYNDIVAVNCTPAGEITWKQAMKKRQHTTNDNGYYSSFYTFAQGDNLYLIYNGNEASLDDAEYASESERKKAERKKAATILNLGVEGEVTRKRLFGFEDDAARTLVPKRCEKMGEKEFLLFTENRKSTIFGWVTL
jgi:hypothetical protein